MAQVLRLTCGKCGNSLTLVAEEKIKQEVGDVMSVTCKQAQKIYPSMGGCPDSKLMLNRIKGERSVIKDRDVLLEGFPKNESAKRAVEAQAKSGAKIKKAQEAGAKKSESDESEAPDPNSATPPQPSPEDIEEPGDDDGDDDN